MIHIEKTIKSEIVYEGKIFNIRRDYVHISETKSSTRDIVVHNGAAAAVVIKDDGKLVMVKQYRKPMEAVILEIPAGKLEKGETPEEAIRREIEEETGYKAKKIELLTKMNPAAAYTTEIITIFIASELTKGKTNFDFDEGIEIVEMDIDDIYKMIMSGDIIDAKTIIGVLMARELQLKTKR